VRKSEIQIGETYKYGGYGLRKATVKEGPVKRDQWSQVYVFICDIERHSDVKLEVKEFDRLWTDVDEVKVLKQRRERMAMESLSNKLAFAGYAPDQVSRSPDGELHLVFSGLSAKRIAEHLLGEEVDLEAIEEDEDE
jgi:hypothetical protein